MNIIISEGKYSESFIEKIESFLIPIIKSEVVPLVKESLLVVRLSILKIDKDGFMYYGIIDVMVAKASLSIWGIETELHWRSSDGKIIFFTTGHTVGKMI